MGGCRSGPPRDPLELRSRHYFLLFGLTVKCSDHSHSFCAGGEEGRESFWRRGVSLGGEGGGKYYEQSMFRLMDSPSA